jgi:hypothetical protein
VLEFEIYLVSCRNAPAVCNMEIVSHSWRYYPMIVARVCCYLTTRCNLMYYLYIKKHRDPWRVIPFPHNFYNYYMATLTTEGRIDRSYTNHFHSYVACCRRMGARGHRDHSKEGNSRWAGGGDIEPAGFHATGQTTAAAAATARIWQHSFPR